MGPRVIGVCFVQQYLFTGSDNVIVGLVDVPPGTSRVRMDGIGGGAQEVSWQRYNGARRSRFIADGQDFVAYPDFEDRRDYARPPERIPEPPPAPPREEPKTTSLEISIRENDRGGSSSTEIVKKEKEKKPKEMWTEITKDLVLKEAIEEMGYGYEETEYYFYVMVCTYSFKFEGSFSPADFTPTGLSQVRGRPPPRRGQRQHPSPAPPPRQGARVRARDSRPHPAPAADGGPIRARCGHRAPPKGLE
jgi:hypothetical protein